MLHTATRRVSALALLCTAVSAQGGAPCTPQWLPATVGKHQFLSAGVNTMLVFDDGSGEALYLGGFFGAFFPDPAGPFTTAGAIVRWDGSKFSALAQGVHGKARELVAFDAGSGAGSELYAVGEFSAVLTPAGTLGAPVAGIARWDGSAWSPVPGLQPGAIVTSAHVYDDGSGSALFVGGSFKFVGEPQFTFVAKWNGATWSKVGAGLNFTAHTFATFDDGHGTRLYAGDNFANSGGQYVGHVATWDGAQWSAVGGGLGEADSNFYVEALTVHDDGSGPALYAGGNFHGAGGDTSIEHIARWNGTSWSAVGNGKLAPIFAMASVDEETGDRACCSPAPGTRRRERRRPRSRVGTARRGAPWGRRTCRPDTTSTA